MRVLAVIVSGVALVLAGCGGVAVSPQSPSPSPAPSRATLRELAAGERVTLACGLSLTVPADYHGSFYIPSASGAADSGVRDSVASGQPAQSSLMRSFSVSSLTDKAKLPPGLVPLLDTWSGGAIEVHGFVVRGGTSKATSMVNLIVRLPGKPRGSIGFMVYGRRASDAPQAILSQASSLWKLFDVRGVSLPSNAR